MYQNTHHHRWWVKAEHRFRIRDASQHRQPEIQLSHGADQQRLQISDLHFDKFPNQQHSLVGRWDFKTEVCICSQFLAEALLWIKEVELVDSVDDLKSSCSVRGIRMPDFEVLDAKIASALNRIIHNSHFKRRISLEEQKTPKRGPFPSWKTDRSFDLRVLPCHWSQCFSRELCGPTHSCSSKWWYSGIRFEVGRKLIISDSNPIWWHLGKLVQIENTRVWETQDPVGNVWPGDSSEEVKTWLSQIEDNGKKKYRADFTDEEFWSQKRKLWDKRRGQESGEKTAWTKKSGRLLAMGSQRAVF